RGRLAYRFWSSAGEWVCLAQPRIADETTIKIRICRVGRRICDALRWPFYCTDKAGRTNCGSRSSGDCTIPAAQVLKHNDPKVDEHFHVRTFTFGSLDFRT